MKKDKNQNKILKWRDASGLKDSGQNEWFDLDEAIKKGKELYEDYCLTSGWVIYEDEKIVLIAGTKSEGVFSDITMIPKCLLF